jgi:signal transduction histidine kinase
MSFSSLVSERHLTVHWQTPTAAVEATVDEGKLKQVLRNLLSNAVKFAPKGSTIALAMHQAAQWVVVSVRDQGPGIPEDELETVFDTFLQSSCHEIITSHQGRIWAANNPDGGAVFSFELPILLPTDAAAELVACGVEDHRSQGNNDV